MTKQDDLKITFAVGQSPDKVFNAVNNVRGWWSASIEGDTDKLGAEWTYRYQDVHYSKQKITKLVPDKNITWHVIDSHISFVKDKEEWTGTDIVFDITKSGDKTLLTFTHKGLVPSIACYDKCAPAWDYYINHSLFKLITTGKGDPDNDDK